MLRARAPAIPMFALSLWQEGGSPVASAATTSHELFGLVPGNLV